jgi:hypothetical protein
MNKVNRNPSRVSVASGTLVIGKNAMLFSVEDKHLVQEPCENDFRFPENLVRNLVSINLLPI